MRVQVMAICVLMGFAALQSCKTAGGSSAKNVAAPTAGESANTRENTSAKGVKKLDSQDAEKFMLAVAPSSGSSSFHIDSISCSQSMNFEPDCAIRASQKTKPKSLTADSSKVVWDILNRAFGGGTLSIDYGTIGYVAIDIQCSKPLNDGKSLCTLSEGKRGQFGVGMAPRDGVRKLNSQDSEKFMLAVAHNSVSPPYELTCHKPRSGAISCGTRSREGVKELKADTPKLLWDILDRAFGGGTLRGDYPSIIYTASEWQCSKPNNEGKSLCTLFMTRKQQNEDGTWVYYYQD